MKEGLKNPLNPSAGRTRIATYKDPAAAITLGASPKFCIAIPATVNPEVLEIGSVDVKKDHRELQLAHADKTWMPPKHLQAVDLKRISDNVVEIIPKQPLPPGQYVLGGPPRSASMTLVLKPTEQTEHALSAARSQNGNPATPSSRQERPRYGEKGEQLQLDGKRCRSFLT